jgi:beta-N-acetylhexosaminidase
MRARRKNSELTSAGADALGQLLFITLDDYKWTSSCERVLRRYQPGGILLTQRNLRTPEMTCEMLSKIVRVLRVPPFLAISEEGGMVDPLRAFFPGLPQPHLAAVKGCKMVERLGSLIGEALALLGFNLNFAPRLDLANPWVKPSLEPQLFSSDPRIVTRCGEAFVMGLRRHKVMACGKHFPGFSAVEYDNDRPLPIVDKPMATLWREDLLPFRQLLPDLAMAKLSYAAYKAYDLDLRIPASLSANVLEGLLRTKLGYRGLAVVDFFDALDQMMTALANSGPGNEQKAVSLKLDGFAQTINAGCDMVVITRSERMFELVLEGLRKAPQAGALSTRRLDESLRRIHRSKKGMRLPTGKFSKKTFDRLCREFEDLGAQCRSAERKNV